MLRVNEQRDLTGARKGITRTEQHRPGPPTDALLLEFMYLSVFISMPDESCRRRFGSLLLCSCHVLRALVNSLCLWVVKSYDWFEWVREYFCPIWVPSALKRVLQIRSFSNRPAIKGLQIRSSNEQGSTSEQCFFRSDRQASKVLQASNVFQISSSSNQSSSDQLVRQTKFFRSDRPASKFLQIRSSGSQSSSDQIVQQSKFFRLDRPASKVLQIRESCSQSSSDQIVHRAMFFRSDCPASNVLQIRSSSNQSSSDQIVRQSMFYMRAVFFRSDRPAVNVLQIRSPSSQCSSDRLTVFLSLSWGRCVMSLAQLVHSLCPFLIGRTFASPNIVRSIRRTLLPFLTELTVRRTWFGQFDELYLCS